MLRWGLSTVRRLGGHDSALCSPRLLTSAGHSLQRTDRSTYSSEATGHVTYELAPGVDVQHKRVRIPAPLQASGNSVVSVNDNGDAALADEVHDSRGRLVNQPRHPRRPSSLDILHIFLSPQNLSSPTPQIHTANTLRALYRSLRPEDLSKLSSQRLADLISIFGTLSASGPPSPHTSALAAHMDKRSFRSWWKVVLQLVRDKKNAGKKMLPSDYYWLVRARTSSLTGIEIDALEDPSNTLFVARQAYLRIEFDHTNPDVHVPYLRTLLSLRRPSATTEVVGWLYALLNARSTFTLTLTRILWDVILGEDVVIPEHMKSMLLTAIWRRMTRPIQDADDRRESRQSDQNEVSSGSGEADNTISCGNTTGLARAVLGAVFPPLSPQPIPTPAQHRIRAWAVQTAGHMLSPLSETPVRWRNLALLAVANAHTPDLSYVSAAFSSSGERGKIALVATDFRVVAVLSLLENIVRTTDLSLEVHSFVRGIWRIWVEAVDDDRSVHPAVVRPIIASFLRLAARARDDHLRRSCVGLCATGFWTFDVGDDFAKRQVQALSADCLVAAAMCGNTEWADMISSLPHFVSIPQWQPNLTRNVLMRLANLDAGLARDVYAAWNTRLEVPSDVVGPLSAALIRQTHWESAMHLLLESQYRFRGEEGERALGAILFPLAKQGDRYIDLQVARLIAEAMSELYEAESLVPPARFRGRISFALLTLVTTGYPAIAINMFKNIVTQKPRYFTGSFVHNFLQAFVAHRQFSSAVQLVGDVAILYPSQARRWRRYILLRLSQNGSHRLAATVAPGVTRRSFGSALAHAIDFDATSVRHRRLAGFRMLRWMKRPRQAESSAGLHWALDLLAQSRSVGAARKVHAHLAQAKDDQQTLGNIILHNYVRRRKSRDGQNVRDVLRALNHLVSEHGFVPDRVTTNIVLKAMLRWKVGMDGFKVRALFDRLIRAGYPGGPRFSGVGEDVPFGTKGIDRLPSGIPLSGAKGEVKFFRHVRPLYKMIVKAMFVRGDGAGARMVVGVLQDVTQETRDRSMRGGLEREGEEHSQV